jgi:aminopeptidase N
MALLGNAPPVLAIHDGRGWHLDPYVSFGEAFYSQVGDFTVTLDAPAGLSLPATGVAGSRRTHDRRMSTTFVATDVRDFAWASGPLQEIDGTSSTGVTVRVWWPSGISLGQAQAALSIGKQAIVSHASKYGPYLYSEVDIVLGLFTAFGGMEYPQFVMAVPNDSVIVHELGHQWWYGIVGDDEYNEPWLDEAFASYVTDVFYGDQGAGCAGIRFPSATARVTNTMKYFTQHASEYGLVVYSIGACALHDLSKTLGPRVMTNFLRSYATGHALGWSTTPDFQAAAQKVASELHDPIDLTPLWHLWRIGPP